MGTSGRVETLTVFRHTPPPIPTCLCLNIYIFASQPQPSVLCKHTALFLPQGEGLHLRRAGVRRRSLCGHLELSGGEGSGGGITL